MTVAEIVRYTEGAVWRFKSKAQFDYALADLIGISVARIMANDVKYPTIEEVYPHLFGEELRKKEEAERKDEASANRFIQFTLQHNAKMRQGVDNEK